MGRIKIEKHAQRPGVSTSLSPPSSSKELSRLNAPLFSDQFDAMLWRPKSSGREKSKVWVESVLRPVVNLRGAPPEARRERFRELLVVEDVNNPSHPNMRAPKDCTRTPYAYRLWPDKVQALVAFDRTLPGTNVPRAVRNGVYQPVGLHMPRLTVTCVTGNLSTGFELSFAETPRTLKLRHLNDDVLQFSRPRDKAAHFLRMRGLERLRRLQTLFANPVEAKELFPYIATLHMPLQPELADEIPSAPDASELPPRAPQLALDEREDESVVRATFVPDALG